MQLDLGGGLVPGDSSLAPLAQAVQACTACPLYRHATGAVVGEGPAPARILLVGEQPGDQEDRQGRPFVGPAGGVLDRALEAAGIDRESTYVTNAVKHFKWKARGPRRIHDRPSWSEQVACKPWLEAELELVRPQVLVLLGATAAQTMLGKAFRVTRQRGEVTGTGLAGLVIATIHPSAVLRGDNREELFAGLVDDLRLVERAAPPASEG